MPDTQDFTNDFGIHPYFDILDRHDRSTYHKQMVFESAKVSALLMLPLNKASFEAQSGYKQSTVVMEQSLSVPDIGSSAMMAPRFKVAIKALRLNAGHIHGAPEPPQAVCNCKEEYGDDDDTDDTPGSLESSHLVEIGDNDENESKVSLDEPNRVSADVQNITVRSASAEQTDDESETSSDDGREDSEGGSGGGLFCFDCDSTDCDGIVQKIKDPALMILGSGKLKTYGQLELYH